MSVLSANEIRDRLTTNNPARRIVLSPLIAPHVGPGTLDIRLGRHFVMYRKTRYLGMDVLAMLRGEGADDGASIAGPGAESAEERRDRLQIQVARTVERAFVHLGGPFVLHPYQLVLACSLEYLALPRDVGAQVLSRSTTGRLGILSAMATFIHPGYRGVLTLELVNTGETAVTITPGMRIAQLLLEHADPSEAEPPGRYQLSTRPEIARLLEDSELERLARLRRPRT